MGSVVELKPITLPPNADAIRTLEAMLEDARSGKIQSVWAIGFYQDETYDVVASMTHDLLKTIGMLRRMEHHILSAS
jgi:hypothetical protein